MPLTLALTFAGRFQCRLATDPDPFDEPYGLRGTAIALPGEPPLDRVIRTSMAGACIRDGAPDVGVRVVASSLPDHPVARALDGAAVTLGPQTVAGGPFFEGWNGIVAPLGAEPLSEVDLLLEAPGGARLGRRRNSRVPARPLPTFEESQLASHVRAVAHDGSDWELDVRRRQLAARIGAAPKGAGAEAVCARLAAIEEMRAAYSSGYAQVYATTLDGPAELPSCAREWTDRDAPWPVELLFTLWDADSMTGVLAGRLDLPLAGT